MLVNSGEFDGLPAPEGGRRIVERLGARRARPLRGQLPPPRLGLLAPALLGLPDPDRLLRRAAGSFRFRTSELPVVLPDVEDYKPQGQPPLAQAEDWVNVDCPPAAGRRGARPRRWTRSSTRPGTSCATATRHNDAAPFDRALVDYWNPVDLYIGGVDHATMHMIYARFWVKVLNDLGFVGFREPFASFFSNGWVTSGKTKISKRSGTAVGPDEFVERYGADAGRLCILFLGPADQDMEWTEEAVEAMARFVRRLWRVVNEVAERAPTGRARERAARAEGARDDREGDRRHRPALRVQHRDLGRDGARQRALARHRERGRALRRRDGRLADPAVRAARGRGAVGAARPRAAVGAAVAGRRSRRCSSATPSRSSCR